MKQTYIAIVGSRSITDKEFVFSTIDHYLSNLNKDEIVIVSGGAVGIDSLAMLYAAEHNIKTEIFKPDWEKYGKSAGFIRNQQIVDRADYLLAITTGSKGTANTIKKAEKKGITIKVKTTKNNRNN
jgi:hypothetical protein